MAIWLAQAGWKEKMGLRFALSFSNQCSNASVFVADHIIILIFQR